MAKDEAAIQQQFPGVKIWVAMTSLQNGVWFQGPQAGAAAALWLKRHPDAAEAAAQLRAAGFEVDYVDDCEGVRVGAVRLEGVRLIDNAPLARGRS